MTHPSDIAGLSERDDLALKRALNIASLIEHGCDEAFATRTVDLWNEKCTALARAEQQRDEAYERAAKAARRLAVTLWEKHFKNDAPQWKPLSGDLIGLLTQIDNMTSALR